MEGGLTTGVAVLETDLTRAGLETSGFLISAIFGVSGRLVRALVVTGLVKGELVFDGVELVSFAFAGNFSVTGLVGNLSVNADLVFTVGTLAPGVKLLATGLVTTLVDLARPVGMDNFRTGWAADSLSELVESATARFIEALARTGFDGLETLNLTGVGFELTADLSTVAAKTLVDAILEITGFKGVLWTTDVAFGAAIGVFLKTVSGFNGFLAVGEVMVVCFMDPVNETGLVMMTGFFIVAILQAVTIKICKMINLSSEILDKIEAALEFCWILK